MQDSLKISQIEDFLIGVDRMFPIPLSKKVDLHQLAMKFHEKATIFSEIYQEKIVAMVVGYTENVIDDKAYISVVATKPEFQGNGIAKKLVNKFLTFSKKKGLKAVHLYTSYTNIKAISLYEAIGFVKWKLDNEPRKEDLHLIYYL